MRKLLLGAVAATLMTSSALAVDLAVPMYEEPGYDWTGFYGGVYGSYFSGPGDFAFGGVLGVNFEIDTDVIGGVEVQGGYFPAGPDYELLAFARLGVAVSDDVLVYGMAGGGYAYGPTVWAAGGGMEVMVSDGFSIGAEAQALGDVGGGGPWFRGAVRALYHFE